MFARQHYFLVTLWSSLPIRQWDESIRMTQTLSFSSVHFFTFTNYNYLPYNSGGLNLIAREKKFLALSLRKMISYGAFEHVHYLLFSKQLLFAYSSEPNVCDICCWATTKPSVNYRSRCSHLRLLCKNFCTYVFYFNFRDFCDTFPQAKQTSWSLISPHIPFLSFLWKWFLHWVQEGLQRFSRIFIGFFVHDELH